MSLKAVILDANTLGEDISIEPITSITGLDFTVYSTTQPHETLERIINCDIIFTNKVVLSKTLLSQAKNLRYIGVLATGVNCIDMAYCSQAGITVKNVEGYGTASVTQHAFMLLLNLACKSDMQFSQVKNNQWQQANRFCLPTPGVVELSGKTATIIGNGELGQAFGTIMQAMGIHVIKAQVPGRNIKQRVPLDEALKQSDIVSLHCLLSDHTSNMMDHERFQLMKKGAFLINTSRGGLIDEAALLHNLQNKHLGGAGIDVLSVEPPKAGNVLLEAKLPNLIITPHWAWGAVESRKRLVELAAQHLKTFINET